MICIGQDIMQCNNFDIGAMVPQDALPRQVINILIMSY